MRASAGTTLAILSAVSFFNYLDRMVLAVLMEPIKRDLGLTDTQLGLVSGLAFALFYALLGLPIARIADRGNRVTLLSICLVLWSAMTALSGLAMSFAMLFFARMMVGVGEAGCVPASHAIIGDRFNSDRRAFAISVFQAGGLLGLTLGLFCAGLIAERFGWRIALGSVGLAGIPLAALTYLALRDRAPRDAGDSATAEPIGAALRPLLGRPALIHLVVGIAVGSFATYGIAQWLAAFFIRSHGMGLAEIGLYSGATGGVGGIVGTVVGGIAIVSLRRRDSRWELWFPAIVYTLSAPMFVAVLLIDNLPLAFTANFAAVFIAASGGGVALAAIQSFAEPRRRATAIAIMLMLSSLLGLGLGPVAVGALSDWLKPMLGVESLRWALVASTAMLVWAGAHFLLAARTAHRDAVA